MFEIHKSSDGQYYFLLKAGNGKTIATSEMYTTKDSCKKGIQSVKDNASTGEINDLA